MAFRVGSGFDIHAFGPGDSVMLAGVRVPHTHAVVAHSDGDVLLHALVDALLGAAGLGDIGMHFPDTDPQWRGADSARFVRHARTLLTGRGYRIVNADLTLLAQSPKIAPWRDAMRDGVAGLLEIEREGQALTDEAKLHQDRWPAWPHLRPQRQEPPIKTKHPTISSLIAPSPRGT